MCSVHLIPSGYLSVIIAGQTHTSNINSFLTSYFMDLKVSIGTMTTKDKFDWNSKWCWRKSFGWGSWICSCWSVCVTGTGKFWKTSSGSSAFAASEDHGTFAAAYGTLVPAIHQIAVQKAMLRPVSAHATESHRNSCSTNQHSCQINCYQHSVKSANTVQPFHASAPQSYAFKLL